jgi:hypothetical protein
MNRDEQTESPQSEASQTEDAPAEEQPDQPERVDAVATPNCLFRNAKGGLRPA